VSIIDDATDRFTMEAIFSTLTNVDFDPDPFVVLINKTVELREAMKVKVAATGGKTDFNEAAATVISTGSATEMAEQGKALRLIENLGVDVNIRSLKQTLLYGLKSITAYADHAAFCYEALAIMLVQGLTVKQCVPVAMQTSTINLRAMELLDATNTGTYGHPVPTSVPLGHRKNKCVLITGHDLHDLELLLKQTEGKGIDVYTHGEMVPCHGYPELKKYPHLYGHFGTAWQNQHKEFPNFPGPILFTTNCIQKPIDEYKDRIFTNGLVGWPGVKHITDKDYLVDLLS